MIYIPGKKVSQIKGDKKDRRFKRKREDAMEQANSTQKGVPSPEPKAKHLKFTSS